MQIAAPPAMARKRLLLIFLALAGIAALQPPDEANVPESEKRIPMGHYCKRPDVAIGPRETRAHHCDCKYSCSIDENGAVVEHEAPECLSFCHLNGRRCTCHVEEPCDPKRGGLVDMDGNLIAVSRNR
jgi:hypothetical protein